MLMLFSHNGFLFTFHLTRWIKAAYVRVLLEFFSGWGDKVFLFWRMFSYDDSLETSGMWRQDDCNKIFMLAIPAILIDSLVI